MEDNEKDLITGAKAGDRKAFDRIVRIYRNKMFALTYRMTGDREVALDLVQDTFFTVFKEIRRFREDSSFSSWIYRIASNKTLNYIKRKNIVAFVPISEKPGMEPSYEMEDQTTSTELKSILSQAVNQLPNKQKMAFTLRFHDKLPFKQIAKVLNKSESTVKTNYQKALEKLRVKLKDFR